MKTLTWLIVLILVVSVACNFPGLSTSGTVLSSEELRQTLEARYTQAPGEESGSVVLVGTDLPTEIVEIVDEGSTELDCGVLIDNQAFYQYCAGSGDTLEALLGRFDVEQGEITSLDPISPNGYLTPGQIVYIPNRLESTLHGELILPDSEAINSPTAKEFDSTAYIQQAGGFLSSYTEVVDGQPMTGAQIIQLIAAEFSVSPRLLLAFLEHRSGWVLGQPAQSQSLDYPIGFHASGQRGLYKELAMVGTHFTIGYYGWRSGELTMLRFSEGSQARVNPLLNAGSVGVQNLFAKFYEQADWYEVLYGADDFMSFYNTMFGDPWERAKQFEPLLSPAVEQPSIALPFLADQRWSLTAGPHDSWRTGSPRGALDLAPVTGEPECSVSKRWATAAGSGVITRSDRSAVVLDLDGDGFEGTGWTILYYHIADKDRIPAGTIVNQDDPIGHPSCEGGRATGTHLHIARKFDGEWIGADGPLPFVMSGWRAYADERNYYGELRNGDRVAVASPVGPRTSIVER